MGSPAIFVGSRTKFLTAGGIELPNRTTAQRDALTPVQGQTIYNSTTGAIEYFDGAVWKKLLESSSKINYFSDFWAKNLNKFIIYNNSSGETPTTGVGGTPNITKSLNTSTPIIETSSYRMSKDANNRQGQGFSITTDVPLDAPITAGEPITVQFRYRTSANYTTGDVRMFVYFVGPNTLQALNGVSNTGEFGNSLVKSFDDRSQFTAITSCPAGTTAIRIIGHIATTSALAYQIDVDEITIGISPTLTAPIITDWVPYTPSVSVGSGSITNFVINGFWKREGDELIVKGTIRFTGNSGTWSGGLYIGLPSPFTVDYSKVKNSSSSLKIQRTGTFEISTSNLVSARGTLIFNNTFSNPNSFGFNIFVVKTDDAGSANDPVIHQTAGYLSNTIIGTTVNDNYITWDDVRIPITQFNQGSNVISSTQVNFFRGALRVNMINIPSLGPNGSAVKVPYDSLAGSFSYRIGGFDFDTTNHRFIARRRILINLSASLGIDGSNFNVLNDLYYLQAVVNGSSIVAVGQSVFPKALSEFFVLTLNAPILLNPGDFLEVFLFGRGDNSLNQLTVAGTASYTYLAVTEIPDLSVVGISGAPLEGFITTSNYVAPTAQGIWMQNLTGNSLTLPPGVWRMRAICLISQIAPAGISGYSVLGIFGGNGTGAGLGVDPVPIDTLPGVQLLMSDASQLDRRTTVSAFAMASFFSIDIIVQAVQTFTAFAVPLSPSQITTPSNARVMVSLRAERVR
jgi:hypothetical protein